VNEQIVLAVIKSLALPPGLALAGLVVTLVAFAARRRRLGFVFGAVTVAGFWFTATWFGAAWLMMPLERPFAALDPVTPNPGNATAIVVLAGGRTSDAPEYGGDTVKSISLERLRYGVRLHRRTGLPLVFSGGVVVGEAVPEAELMATAAREEFGVEPAFVETKSRNTAENARYTVELLEAAGIDEVVLVTHAFHMLRSTRAFAHYGFEVVPAPTRFVNKGPPGYSWDDFTPNARALTFSKMALHERIGVLWYRVRYGIGPAPSETGR